MAKQIKRTDIVEDDIFKVTRESAEATLITINKLNQELKDTARVLKDDISKAMNDSAAGINNFVKSSEKANKIKVDSVKLDEQEIKVRQQLVKLAEMEEKQRLAKEKADAAAINNAQKLQREQEKQAKAMEKQAKAEKDAASAYKQLEKNTRDLKNQSKELAAQMLVLEKNGGKATKEYRSLEKQYKEVTKAAQQGDAALKKIDSTVGDNFRNVGNYRDAIGGLKNMLGQLGLAFGIGTIVSDATRTVIEFDQAIADLVSITGASGSDLEFFKQQAIDLGSQVQGGASAVVEAYKLIGSAKPELLQNAAALNDVTKAAITLSQASGMELPEAATALTDALNQFGAPAEEAGRFIDALANGALFGSAEIPQVTEALLKFGAVANTANVSLEESTGLIEALAEKGLKGAEAGTALRNVMLKLSAPDALPKEAKDRLDALGISFADLQDTSKPFAERLDALKPLLNDNAALVKVFGTENAVAATNLLSNTDRIKELTAQMATQGTASKQAEDRTKTLSFALNQLKEKWNGLILSFSEGAGAGKVLTGFISFLANNLGTIVSLVGKAALAWGAYKAILLAVQAKQYLFNGGLKNTISGLGNVFKSTKQAAEGAEQMAASTTKAGRAMNAIPWMAIIGFAIELATAFYDIATNANEAREAQEKFDKSVAEGEKKATERVTKRQDALQKEIAQLQRLRNENKISEKEFLQQKEKALSTTKKQITQDIKAVNERKKQYNEELKLAAAIENKIKKQGDVTTLTESEIKFLKDRNAIFNTEGKNASTVVADLRANIGAADAKILEYRKELDQATESTKDATSEVNALAGAEEKDTKKKEKKTKVQKQLNTVIDEYNEYLTKQNELLAKIDEIQSRRAVEAKQGEIDVKLANDLKYASETGEIQVDALEKLIEEKYALEKAAIEKQNAEKLVLLEQQYTEESRKEREALIKKRDELLKQENLTAEAKEKIKQSYNDQLEQIEQNDLQRNADLELEKIILADETNQQIIELEKEKSDEINDVNDKLIDAQTKYYEERSVKSKEATEKEIENEKLAAEKRMEIAQAVTDWAIEQSNKRIEQIDKELAKAQEQSDYYKQLAAEGNIQAAQSLAEQERLIAEANRKKEQELKRQERIQFANTVFQAYQKNASDDSVKNPLVKTITDVTLLSQFIKSFPAFLEGTEDTGTNGQGVDGKGGFHAILHPNERVLTKEQNALVGNISNSELAKIASEYNTGQLINKGDNAIQIGGPWQADAIVKKLDEISKVISSKPETNIQLGEIINGAMTIIKSQKAGNNLTYNRYKIK